MKYSEIIKDVRATAKKAGLTFKAQRGTINGSQAYRFEVRKTGLTVLSNYTLASAWNDCLSGFIESFDSNTNQFRGV